MLDVYFGNMDGVEVHAETPEEEQEAAFILNSALSGKTTFLGGCLCPSEADSTVSKGFRLMLSEGTDLYVTPALDVDGTPALEICSSDLFAALQRMRNSKKRMNRRIRRNLELNQPRSTIRCVTISP